MKNNSFKFIESLLEKTGAEVIKEFTRGFFDRIVTS